jgi:zinc-ribbon domain
MAFCSSCGSNVEAGARFCPQCGAPAAAGAPAATSSAVSLPPAPPAKSSSLLKIILILVAGIVVLGIVGLGTFAFVVHRIVTRSHMETSKDGSVKVDMPFGTVESTEDPNQAARNVGVELYPGATLRRNGSANVAFGNIHSATAEFETDDPVASVAAFYGTKFPAANVTSSGERTTILAGDQGNMTTIIIEPEGGKTRIHVVKITGKGVSH